VLLSLGLILFDVLLSVAGQISLKIGVTQLALGGMAALADPVGLAIRVVTTPIIVAAIGLYVLALGAWLVALSRLHLSLAYPLLSLIYVLIPIAAWLILGEHVPAMRWLGIGVTLAGIGLLGRS
jgi:multidrug transporter EmrE-like cation transporter